MTNAILEFVTEHYGKLSAAIGAFVSFLVGRKTKKNNETAGELENIKTVREIERNLLEDMEEQIKKLIQTNNTLEAIIRDQSKKLRNYEKKYGPIKPE